VKACGSGTYFSCLQISGNNVTEGASNILTESDKGGGVEAAAPVTIAFEDTVLIDRCRKGDMQAFGLLVAKYQDRLFNMVYRMCGRRADAEELAQEAFLKALQNLPKFRGQSRFYTWLFRIAANLTISHRRRAGRVAFHSMTQSDDFDGTQAEGLTASIAERRAPSPEAVAMSAEAADRVTQALDELDDEFRLVVILRDIEDMDYTEVAEVVGVPVGTVKSRLHRARCMLREKLHDLVG